ncbi:MAG: hypothetical protein DSY86_09360, partial [Marinomonas sp.]
GEHEELLSPPALAGAIGKATVMEPRGSAAGRVRRLLETAVNAPTIPAPTMITSYSLAIQIQSPNISYFAAIKASIS